MCASKAVSDVEGFVLDWEDTEDILLVFILCKLSTWQSAIIECLKLIMPTQEINNAH